MGLTGHTPDVFDPEGEDVSVADGVDGRVGVQHVTERLFGGLEVGAAAGPGVFRSDRRPGESEDVILFEGAGDRLVHIAELRTVTLVEDDDEMARIDLVILLLLDEDRKFLDRGDDDAGVRVRGRRKGWRHSENKASTGTCLASEAPTGGHGRIWLLQFKNGRKTTRYRKQVHRSGFTPIMAPTAWNRWNVV